MNQEIQLKRIFLLHLDISISIRSVLTIFERKND